MAYTALRKINTNDFVESPQIYVVGIHSKRLCAYKIYEIALLNP